MNALSSGSAIWSDQRTINAPETCDKHGAEALAARIEKYWRDQGKTVRCWTVPMDAGLSNRAFWYAVRSNMIGGQPR